MASTALHIREEGLKLSVFHWKGVSRTTLFFVSPQ